MNKNIHIIGITLLFIGVAVAPLIQGIVIEESKRPISDGNTLYVGGDGPGNYTSIQEALDNASNGDTVFVYNGTYYEKIVIQNSITFKGEDKENTIIDGYVIIRAYWVTVKDFTVINEGYAGIELKYSNYNNITGNYIIGNITWNTGTVGIGLWKSGYNNISDNIIGKHNSFCIRLDHGSINNIIQNNILSSGWVWCDGIGLFTDGNLIINNTITNNDKGIYCSYGYNNVIMGNTICNNEMGLYFSNTESNEIFSNNISSNKEIGFYLFRVRYTIVFDNNFIDNSVHYVNDLIFINTVKFYRNYWYDWYGIGPNSQAQYRQFYITRTYGR